MFTGQLDIDLMTVPKLPKNVSKNAPNFVAGGGARGLFEFQKMPQTLLQEALRDVFLKFWYFVPMARVSWRSKKVF